MARDPAKRAPPKTRGLRYCVVLHRVEGHVERFESEQMTSALNIGAMLVGTFPDVWHQAEWYDRQEGKRLWNVGAQGPGAADLVSGVRPMGSEGQTFIWVRCDEFEQAYCDRESIVLSGSPMLHVAGMGNVRQALVGGTSHLYYRNMRALALEKPSLWTWNVISNCDLTEDRTIKHAYIAHGAVVHMLWTMGEGRAVASDVDSPVDETRREQERDLLVGVLGAPEGTYEHGLNFAMDRWWGTGPSEGFLDTVQWMRSENMRVNLTAIDALYKARRKAARTVVVAQEDEQRDLAWAIALCEMAGWDVSSYEIRIADTLGQDTLGLAETVGTTRTIWLSRRAFTMGRRMLAGTLFEEWLHLKHGHVDESRGMQNHLIDLLMQSTERLYEADVNSASEAILSRREMSGGGLREDGDVS